MFARDPAAVAVVESALIFEVERDARARGESEGVLADWRNRFDHIIVLTAPDEVKIARYADAGRARQVPAREARSATPAFALRARCRTLKRRPAPISSSRIRATWRPCARRSSRCGGSCSAESNKTGIRRFIRIRRDELWRGFVRSCSVARKSRVNAGQERRQVSRVMRLRRLLLVVLLVGGFWYVTTHLPSGLAHLSLLEWAWVRVLRSSLPKPRRRRSTTPKSRTTSRSTSGCCPRW